MRGIELIKRLGGGTFTSGVDLIGSIMYGLETAEWKLDSDGFTYGNVGAGMTALHSWIDPQVGMGLYDVKATFLSGTLPDSGTLSTWENAGTDRTWALTGDGEEVKSCALRIDLRLSSTGTVVDSANVTLNVGSTGGGGGGTGGGGGGGGFHPPPGVEEF